MGGSPRRHDSRWHTDLDKSGGKLSPPGFGRALDRIHAGRTGGIVVAKLDRFSRAGVADAPKPIEAIYDAGGQVASIEQGIDPSTAFGEFGGRPSLSRRTLGGPLFGARIDPWPCSRTVRR